MKKWNASAASTVTKKRPKDSSASKPDKMNVLPTSAKTPIGAKRMIHMVIAIITSCTPVQKLCNVSPAWPFMRDMK